MGTALQIKWLKDGSYIDMNSDSRLSGGTVDTESLTITNVQNSDAGNYICEATDSASDDIVHSLTINVSPIAKVCKYTFRYT